MSNWAGFDKGEVGEIDPASQMPAADEVKDIQFMWASRDILDDVEANSRPRGDDNWGFDATGPIKYGVTESRTNNVSEKEISARTLTAGADPPIAQRY